MKKLYLTIFVFPLWTLNLSIKYFRLPQAQNLFWLFCIFLGLIHVYFPDIEIDTDGFRYAQRLIELNQQPISLGHYFSLFYTEGGFVDIYQPVITYLFSNITNNPRWLFLFFSFVFGFFYSRNIWFVLNKFPSTIGLPLFLFTLYFILICPIWNINGVRMWTAFHVFVYGALPYLFNSDKSKLIFCFISVFFHFSFIIPLFVIIIYYFVPKSLNIFFTFFVISLFIKELNIEQIKLFLENTIPTFLLDRVNGYVNEEYSQHLIETKSALNFYVEGSKKLVNSFVTILFAVIFIWSKFIIRKCSYLLNMFCFSLFVYSISNILSLIPSVDRFIILSQMFSFIFIILFYIYYMDFEIKQTVTTVVYKYSPIMLIIPILVTLRMACDFYGISFFLNPLALIFIEDNQPIIQLIKSIL